MAPVQFPRLTIKPRSGVASPLLLRDLTFHLDDYELHAIEGVVLRFARDAANHAEIRLTVGEVHVDAEALVLLEAQSKVGA